MASNDEYQHVQFWEDKQPAITCYIVEQEIVRSRPMFDGYITAPLDALIWTKTEEGWEYKTK